MYKIAFMLLVTMTCLVGCAPLQVDLSHSEYQPKPCLTAGPKHVQSVTVIDRAPTPEAQNKVFGPSMIPIKTAVPLRSTVDSDVKLLLAETLQIDNKADKSVLVTIRRADAYWTMSALDKIPFIGIATSFRDKDFITHVVLSFEVRKDGRVTSTYSVDRQVKIVGKASTRDDIADSYKRLIAKYRQDVLGDIEHNFIDKSL